MIERIVLGQLVYNGEYARRVLPYLKSEYFENANERTVYDCITAYFDKYNTPPDVGALKVDLSNVRSLNESSYRECLSIVEELDNGDHQLEWLIDQTEEFCKDRAAYIAVMKCIDVLEGVDKTHDRHAIQDFMKEALAVSFDTSIGHDYVDNAEDQFKFYHTKETKLPFDIEYMNRITDGGITNRTLTVIVAGTGVGKSMLMGHMAAAHYLDGKNVLYITLEMSEARIRERMDANILDTDISELRMMHHDKYMGRIKGLVKKTAGRLIIKEYPTSSAHVGHFRHLLNELKLRQNFKPDVIYVDYLNICASARMRRNSDSSYHYVKSIAEELRGLAQEFDVPIITATQLNRGGYGSSDVDLTDVSESWGINNTADLMFALLKTEQLDSLGQVMIKQLKNRYRDENRDRRFVIGVDRSRMRFYDLEESAQRDLYENMQQQKQLPSKNKAQAQEEMEAKYPITHRFRGLEV